MNPVAVDRYATVEVQVDKIAQIFATLDPMPFRERDLDREAQEFIVDSARELPQGIPIRIIVHLPSSETGSEHARELGSSLNSYFRYRANIATGDIKELFRTGRFALIVGLGVLAICIVSGRLLVAALPAGPFRRHSE
jgi:hypothetical protein